MEAAGARIDGVGRRGKYLLIGLDDGRELVIHLGMTGQLRLRPGALDPYVRAWLALDDGEVLELRDVRRFGALSCGARRRARQPADARGPGFFFCRRRNIYADEALCERRCIRPAHVTRRSPRWVLTALRDVLTQASTTRHHAARLPSGRRPEGATSSSSLLRPRGEPCLRCGAELRRGHRRPGTTHRHQLEERLSLVLLVLALWILWPPNRRPNGRPNRPPPPRRSPRRPGHGPSLRRRP